MLSQVEQAIVAAYDAHCLDMVEDDDPPLPVAAQRLFEKLAPGTRLIDIGCGYGRVIPALSDAGITADRYTGIDPSTGQLELARRFHPQYSFQQADIYEIGDLFPNIFDAFFLTCVLMHLPRHRVGEALRSVRACLKTGAVGYLSVLHGEGGFMNRWGQQVCRYGTCDLTRELTNAGLDPTFWIKGQSIVGTVLAV